MRTYKVLLVDDHRVIREGIRAMVDWAACGYQLAGTADNGVTALEFLKNEPCDLVITDVRMPEMSGIELIRRIRELYGNDIEIMVISAYGEFEYAKAAMEYGINNYLLKPIASDKLIESLMLIHSALTEREKQHQHEAERVLLKLLISPQHSATEEIFEKTGIPLNTPYFCLTLLHLDAFDEKVRDLFGTDETAETAQDIIMKFLSRYAACHSAQISDDELLILFLPNTDELNFIRRIVSELVEYLELYSGARAQAVIGDIVTTSNMLSTSYSIVRSVMSKASFWKIDGSMVTAVDSAKDIGSYPSFDIEGLLSAVRSMDSEAAMQATQQLIRQFLTDYPPIEQVRATMTNIMFQLTAVVTEMNGDPQDALSPSGYHDLLYRISNVDELSAFLNDTVLKLCEYLHKTVKRDGQIRVTDVVKYIQENYAESLTVKGLSEIFYVSPIYLGRLFSVRMGVSLNSYVNTVRIQKARELLEETDLKVYAICNNIGYKSIKYFYKVFKDEVGMTPHEYRLIHGMP